MSGLHCLSQLSHSFARLVCPTVTIPPEAWLCLWRSGAWMLVGALSEDRIDVHRLEDGVPVAPPHSSTDAVSPAHLLFLPPRHQRERDRENSKL